MSVLRNYYSRKTRIILKLSLVMLVVILLVSLYVHYKVKEYTEVICISTCQRFGQTLINDAIEQTIYNCNYNELVKVSYSEDGKINGISADNMHINLISSSIIEYIGNKLGNSSDCIVSVPAGTFSGISFLGGAGPDVDIEIFQVGSPDVEIYSTIESAGVNQSLYKIYAVITLELAAVMPTENVEVTIEREVLLTETVIIGDVPSAYLNGNL